MINCRGLFVPEPLISGFSDLGGPELDDCFTKRLVRLHQPQILPPAAKMNDRKQNEKTPLVPKQTRHHHHNKNHGGQCSCLKCFPVKCHSMREVLEF